jgi:hypothetical protein
MKIKIYLIAVCLLPACSEKNVTPPVAIKVFNTLEIPIENSFNPDITRTQYIESDSGEFLAIKNRSIPEIIFFNIEQERATYKIPLFSEGPNNIGVDNGFEIVGLDCLLIASIPPKIKILNFKGEVKFSIPIEDIDNDVNFLVANNETPFLFNDDKLFGAQPFLRNFLEITEIEAVKVKHIYQVNMFSEKEIVQWIPIYRPDNIWSEGRRDENFSWTDRYDSIIVAPYTDHRLWIISKSEKTLIDYKAAKSTSVNNFHEISQKTFGGDKGIIENLKSDRYEIIIYDKYRDVFYRFFFLGVDSNDYSITPRELLGSRPKAGIMVLNSKLDLIGEHFFETHQIQSWNYFVGKKGLYVSTNNPNRDDFDENFLRYDIIRFEGLKYDE